MPDHDIGNKSVVTSDSDWQPPGGNTRLRRVDFTGRVTTSTYHSTQQQESDGSRSSCSDHIPWVPNPDDISSADSGEVENLSGFVNEQRTLSAPSIGLPTYPSQTSTMAQQASSSSNNDTGWETGSEYSSDDDVGSSVWTSDLRLEDDHDDDDDNAESSHDKHDGDPNPTHAHFNQNLSGHSIDFVREEEEEQQQRQIPQGRRAFSPPPPVRGFVRNPSYDSNSESIDSVLSYTGRISFKTSPEVITFVDDPNEDRGTHYTRYGRTDLSQKRKSSSSSYSSKPPDPCIYYTLCCIMVALPTTILIIMFMFVIDLDGNDDNVESN